MRSANRFPAIFAMILVGAALPAAAQPKQEETSGRVSLNEDDAQSDSPRAPSDWVELADPSPVKHGTMFIVVGEEAGGFGKLRLDATKGQVVVKRVEVTFADGKSKVYKVRKRLHAKRKPSLFIELPTTTEIDRVIVTTDKRGNGMYTLHGSGTGGVIATR